MHAERYSVEEQAYHAFAVDLLGTAICDEAAHYVWFPMEKTHHAIVRS